jgi:hypothetical protein
LALFGAPFSTFSFDLYIVNIFGSLAQEDTLSKAKAECKEVADPIQYGLAVRGRHLKRYSVIGILRYVIALLFNALTMEKRYRFY